MMSAFLDLVAGILKRLQPCVNFLATYVITGNLVMASHCTFEKGLPVLASVKQDPGSHWLQQARALPCY